MNRQEYDMSELDFAQITEKLNTGFTGPARSLIFWYDADAEFAEDIDLLELDNASVLHLEKDNQFYIKHFLECEDRENNYLIYAPFPKPDIRENHLEDTIKYSREFFADRASLIAVELGLDESLKDTVRRHMKFFVAKDRIKKLSDLEVENYSKGLLETAMMSVLCRSRTASFEEVVRCIITDDDFRDSCFIEEFGKYDLKAAFWEHAEDTFGYQDEEPTLEKLLMTMFITYTARSLHCSIPSSWESFRSHKAGNIIAFMDNMMNSYLYGSRFDEISEDIYRVINGEQEFRKVDIADMTDCCAFAGIDRYITAWITGRLEREDTGTLVSGMTIPELCRMRRKSHFGRSMEAEYILLENAWEIIKDGRYAEMSGAADIVKWYTSEGCRIDTCYRYFHYHMDRVEDSDRYDELSGLVEKIYTNEYLDRLCVNWNREFVSAGASAGVPSQDSFFQRYISSAGERIVVIISDALRYEVGRTLHERLQDDEKCTSSISPMLSMLPSYTALGMAALLPHRELAMTEDHRILVDGKAADSLKQREDQLQSSVPDSRCVQYDDIRSMKIAELRKVFTGQQVVYVYHDQIDARGDKYNTENEVFSACEEAVEEIHSIIRRLSTSANTIHFIVTADHGFIYKHEKLQESSKIDGSSAEDSYISKRYCISSSGLDTDGVVDMPADRMLPGDDRIMSFPVGTDVFKAPGSGMNYVHGGSSLQEMLIPVIDVRTEKGRMETSTAKISLVSIVSKITNLINSFDFVQTEAVSDVVKPAVYRLYFMTSEGEIVSNENLYTADRKDAETVQRIFKLKFVLKNMRYDRSQRYYLVAVDENSRMEVFRHEVVIDIAFADDFGF